MESDLRREIEDWEPDPALSPIHDDWFPPIFQRAPFGLAALDLGGVFIRVNEACAHIHGRTVGEMIGMSALSMNHDPASEVDNRASLEFGLRDETPRYQNEHQIKRPDGGTAWAMITATTVLDSDGNPSCFLIQYHDTTVVHDLTDEVAAFREIGDITFRHAPIAIYSVDLAGKVLDWNPEAERLFGWTRDEVLGLELPIVHEERRKEADQALSFMTGGKTIRPTEVVLRHKDGHELNMIASASTVHSPSGEPQQVLAFTYDITRQRQAEVDARAGAQVLRSVLGRTSESVTTLSADGRVKSSIGGNTDDLGYPDEFFENLDAFSLLHPDDSAQALELFEEVRDTPGARNTTVLRLRDDRDEYAEYEVAAVNLLDDPDVEGVVITTRTVTELTRARALMADEARILELIATGAPLDNILGAITSMTERMSHGGTAAILLIQEGRMLLTASDSVPSEIRDLIDGQEIFPFLSEVLQQGNLVVVPDVQADERLGSGAGLQANAAGIRAGWLSPIIDVPTGERMGLLSTHYQDPTEVTPEDLELAAVCSHLAAIAIARAHALDTLSHQAHHDSLTGLPNRAMILKQLEELVHRDSDERTAVLFIDLDRFKIVNDSLGHVVGDELLRAFADRLRAAAHPDDLVGRFSADEFVVLVEGREGRPEAMTVLSRLEVALDEPFIVDEGHIFLSASTGIAESRGGEYSAAELIEQASAAMVAAKKPGRGQVEVYDHRMRAAALERLQLERDLRLAADRDEFVLYYQPKIDLTTGAIIGAEALLRWQHPERGLIYPNDFIPMAEETGIIVRVGRWVLERAVQQAREWRDDLGGLDGFVMAVNFSARQMAATDLINNIGRVLLKHAWSPDQLSVELTESILIDDSERSLEVVNQLKSLGVKLTIDDFGTGYSSLSYLHRFPVDVVKIDRAFVTDLQPDGSGSAVAAAVMQIGEALGIVTSAEGVETQSQLQGLRALGCKWAQGFLIAKAIPPDEMRDLLATNPTW